MSDNEQTLQPDDFLTRSRKTRGYIPSVTPHGMMGASWIDGRPWFTLADVERMKRDPQVIFGLRILRSPLYEVTWNVECDDQRVAQFVDDQMKKIWQDALPKLEFFEYGYAPAEVCYDDDSGMVQFDALYPVLPRDAYPLEYIDGDRKGELAGFQLRSSWMGSAVQNLFAPHAFWFAGEAKYGSHYGRPRIAGAFEPWIEKRGRHGAVQSRQLWYKKCAFDGGEMRHPPGSTNMGTDDSPLWISNQDLAREIGEKFENGGFIAIPNAVDETSGKYQWEWRPPQARPDSTSLVEYCKVLDQEILIGMGIPPELVQAASVGSGYSGRAIPAQVFFSSLDEVVRLLVQAFRRQIVDHLVAVNFGDVDYHIEVDSLAQKAIESDKPSGGGGGNPLEGLMGDGGDEPPAEQPAEPPAGQQPKDDDPLTSLGLSHNQPTPSPIDRMMAYSSHRISREQGQQVYLSLGLGAPAGMQPPAASARYLATAPVNAPERLLAKAWKTIRRTTEHSLTA